MGTVVITYEEQDFETAREIARELEIAGYSTWYRWRDGCVGPSFVGQCERRMSEAGALVAVVSQSLNAPVSHNRLASDIETARAHAKRIVFVARDITREEIGRRRTEWSDACETGSFARLTSDGVRAMMLQLIETLKRVGVEPSASEQLPVELAQKVSRYRLPAVLDVHDAINDYDVARMMDRDTSIKYKAIPLDNVGDVVVIAASDPAVVDEIHRVCFPLSHGVEPVLGTEESIVEAIEKVHRITD